MNDKEKLKSIEVIVKYHLPNFEVNWPQGDPYPLKTESVEWLIDRVKVFMEALEKIADHDDGCSDYVARKALGLEE